MAKKKSKQDRKYQMPRMVCKGCGKDCKSSILLHLKRLSCRSEYTEEEYNDLKLKAKEVSDLNKKCPRIFTNRRCRNLTYAMS